MVRWALHVRAQEAMEQAQVDAREVATVFASSGGETGVLDRLCTALAAPTRMISPTLFHHPSIMPRQAIGGSPRHAAIVNRTVLLRLLIRRRLAGSRFMRRP